LSLTALAALAQGIPADKERALRAAIQDNTGGKVTVNAITATPVPGIYAVQTNGEVFYTDTSGRYSFVNASLIDTKERKDLTQAMDEQINRIDFKSLPLDQAIKEVHGQGTRKIAIFEDPNCPICKVFTKFLAQVPDVTIYRFMYPVISPESLNAASAAWCSNDRAQAWKAVMNGARLQQDAGTAGCDTAGLKAILEFGAQHRILETPTVVLADGRRLVGAVPPEEFLRDLKEGGR
jgi:thiol:disulfide interchange protein DsbC